MFAIKTQLLRLGLLLLFMQCHIRPAHSAKRSYIAAVYEHAVINPHVGVVSREDAVALMKRNLAIYKRQVKAAKQQNAEIIVFPEYGISGVNFNEREEIYPYLEAIPDPVISTSSPCTNPTPGAEVQHELSCMAQNNSIYLVANMGDKVICDTQSDLKCPKDGKYQYNTNVVYGPNGNLLTKYHKRHLFFENYFDSSDAEYKYFDTPFGRFGTAICFDLLFQDPILNLVTRHNITDIVYPTAWVDLNPFMTAIGYHSSYARGLGINLLAAGLHKPHRTLGSGIYTPKGVSKFYYNNIHGSQGKLILSSVNRIDEESILKQTRVLEAHQFHFNGARNEKKEFDLNIHIDFTFRELEEAIGEIKVCRGDLCCYLNYEMNQPKDENNNNQDLFAFGAGQGMFTISGQGYIQICSLVRCPGSNRSFCGRSTFESATTFKSLHMKGTFASKYIYPQVILSAGNDQLEPAMGKEWKFLTYKPTVKVIQSDNGFINPLMSASLVSRDYTRDPGYLGDSSQCNLLHVDVYYVITLCASFLCLNLMSQV